MPTRSKSQLADIRGDGGGGQWGPPGRVRTSPRQLGFLHFSALEATPRDPKHPRQFWVGGWGLYSGAGGPGGVQTRKRRISRVRVMPAG